MAFIFCMGCVLTVETASLRSHDHFCHFVAANSSIGFSLLREIYDRVKLSHTLLMYASEITSQANLRNIIKQSYFSLLEPETNVISLMHFYQLTTSTLKEATSRFA